MELIKQFNQLNKNDTAIAGGKGASLGEMTQAGIPVPPGFVVLATTFERFIQEVGINVEIDTLLHSVKPEVTHTVDAASEQIQALIRNAWMPQEIADEILKQFDVLGAEYVAVRSSATAEDSASAAWAGQLDTFLNTTRETVLKHVQECWASLFTQRAIFYRFEKDLQTTKISVAVVIQTMVNSEKSGIAFSVHPVTEDRNQLIIEAGFGLGEAIVSGQITPDSYVVEKEPRRIIDTKVSEQSRGLFRVEGGGNEWCELGVDGSQQVLAEKEILELSEVILRIENHYGFPCDIEWAYEAGQFYIVQSRPITTLSQRTNNDMIVITEKMVFRGKRRVTPHSARLKAQSWSTAWQEELGIGFRIAIINSDGENWMDAQSAIELREFFHQKDLNFAKAYMAKFDQLRSQLLDQVQKDVHGDYDEQFIKLLAYCFITRWVIEPLFESLTDADQKMIEAWRNDEQLFLPMDIWYRANDQEAPDHEWSIVVRNGTVQMYPQKLSFFEKEPTESNLLKGSPAYGGNVTGTVRVILSPLEFNQMQPGEILVASMTTPDYSPVLKKASAIITDEGGVTSHAAIYARELKIPCVIGTRRATKALKTGDMVEVDATSGIVKIIK